MGFKHNNPVYLPFLQAVDLLLIIGKTVKDIFFALLMLDFLYNVFNKKKKSNAFLPLMSHWLKDKMSKVVC